VPSNTQTAQATARAIVLSCSFQGAPEEGFGRRRASPRSGRSSTPDLLIYRPRYDSFNILSFNHLRRTITGLVCRVCAVGRGSSAKVPVTMPKWRNSRAYRPHRRLGQLSLSPFLPNKGVRLGSPTRRALASPGAEPRVGVLTHSGLFATMPQARTLLQRGNDPWRGRS